MAYLRDDVGLDSGGKQEGETSVTANRKAGKIGGARCGDVAPLWDADSPDE
jgi:hypothetical protein